MSDDHSQYLTKKSVFVLSTHWLYNGSRFDVHVWTCDPGSSYVIVKNILG
jgi:hypothetical protein